MAAGAPWPSDYGIDLSRGFEALGVWMQLKEHGLRGIGAAIERTILAADSSGVAVAPEPGPLLPEETAAVLLDGHYADLARALAVEARGNGIPVVLDCGRWRPVYADLLPMATDVIMCATFRPPEWTATTASSTPAVRAEPSTAIAAATPRLGAGASSSSASSARPRPGGRTPGSR